MSDKISIKKFTIFNDFDEKLLKQINKFYLTKNVLLFATFYYLHEYKLSDKKLNNENEKLKTFQPSHEKLVIIKLDCSYSSQFPHFLALTDNGSVYSWGYNEFGQLGNGTDESRNSPKLIDFISEEHIVDICCGFRHSIMLTNEGNVFSFGWNFYGQCGNCTLNNMLVPTQAALNVKVNAIFCGESHSIALTEIGEIYGWGWNLFGQLGIEDIEINQVPTQICNHIRIIKVVCGRRCTLLLSTDGDIYFCGEINEMLSIKYEQKIESNIKFAKIAASNHSQLCVAMTKENICYILGTYNDRVLNKLQETYFTSIEETFAFYDQITYNTIETNASKYNICFAEISLIKSGGFSTVFKSRQKKNNVTYAIKKIGFTHEDEKKVTKEINFLKKLDSKFFVKFFDSWIESNYYHNTVYIENSQNKSSSDRIYSPHSKLLLHIQMELCSLTLKDAINKILDNCKTTNNKLSFIGYYISSELMYEILECVHYLHSHNPPIIHRDIKPDNILLTNFVNNRFVKLSDFGLSTFHEFDNQSHTINVGTRNYKAPELGISKNYTPLADIYSLGVLLQEMFIIDPINTEKDFNVDTKTQMKYLIPMIKKILFSEPNDRPNCDQLLNEQYYWRLKDKQLEMDKELNHIITSTKVKSIEENFIEFFILNKYTYSKNETVNDLDKTKILSNSVLNISSHLWDFFILDQNNPNNKPF